MQPEIFQDKGSFVELENFDKQFVKNTKKGPAGKNFGFVFLDNPETTFSMKNLTKR